MCLYLNSKANADQKPFIAKIDIKVWKVLIKRDTGYYSGIRDFEYEKGFHYYEEEPLKVLQYMWESRCRISVGLHGFTKKESAVKYKHLLSTPTLKLIIVQMIVPKGANYYRGKDDEGLQTIVSDQLIWY